MKLRLLSAFLVTASFALAQQAASAAPEAPAPAPDQHELAALEGRVVNQNGEPLKKANLVLRPIGKPGQIGSGSAINAAPQPYGATTDAEGKFSFDGIEPGRYLLSVERAGYVRQNYGAKSTNSPGTMLTLTAGQRMKDIRFKLTPQATISGKVLDDEGDPVARAQVRVMRQGFMNGRRQLMMTGGAGSDESGEYKVTGLAPGRYYLSVAPPRMYMMNEATRRAAREAGKPEEDLATTYYPGVLDASAAAPIEIIAGHDLPGTDIRLKKTQVFRIRGKVTGNLLADSAGRYRISLMPRENNIFFGFGGPGSNIAKDGSFEIPGVQPGAYTLAVMNMNGMVQVLARQPLDVGGQNVDGIVLSLQPPADLQGVVKVEGPEKAEAPDRTNPAKVAPTQRASISLLPMDGMPVSMPHAIAGEDGTFTLSHVSPGKYRVNAGGGPKGSYLKSVRMGDQESPNMELDLTQGISGALQVVFSTGAAEITGTVKSEDQQVSPGGTVTLVPDPGGEEHMQQYRTATVDQNGSFSFESVAPGKYRVFAWEDLEPGAQYDAEYLKPFESLGSSITVGENAREQVSITRISAERVEQAKQKNGR